MNDPKLTQPPQPMVYVVDDDEDVRMSLETLLQSAGLPVATYASAEQFWGEPHAPCGCVITDLRMPGQSGIELQAELQRRQSNLAVILITGFGDVPAAVVAMKQGAIDFVEKPYAPEMLLDRINAAIEHSRRTLQAQSEREGVAALLGQLTPREREVIDGVAAGKANKVLAAELGISERTIEIHRGNGMKKLGVRSAANLVRLLDTATP